VRERTARELKEVKEREHRVAQELEEAKKEVG